MKVHRIAIMALMAAISIILARFFAFMIGGTIRIAFDHAPLYLAGMLLGPLGGAMTGVVADLVGILINPMGGFFPGFTLSYALLGFIPGYLFKEVRLDRVSLKKVVITLLVTDIIVSVFMNTFWLSIMFGDAFWAILPARLVARAIIMPVQIFFIYTLLNYVPVLPLERINYRPRI
ncbi:folate family ECF transporter S component [Halarsenatibacter silvermanii]|uniref:ECF transporter S component, folate family n=1 Tax=Halarsenatibacter silvermanii TaxID=321763 RepID=A0A1G9PV16_9FIRM|nr:folate family ECF transporter S component [Halarsenatibacter silvermanii]SDM02610.1 ECF transporter S component, folate family [Halarsenatibacter silvermanii]